MSEDTYRPLTIIKGYPLDDFRASGGLPALARLITVVHGEKHMNSYSDPERKDLAIAEVILADLMANAMSRLTKLPYPHPAREEEVAWALDTFKSNGVGNKEDIATVRKEMKLESTKGWIGETAKSQYTRKLNEAALSGGMTAG